jgi:internalin A
MKNTLLTQIIDQSFEDKNPFLDLGNCGLTELPEVLTEMWWVEELRITIEDTLDESIYNEIDFKDEKNGQILRGMVQVKSLDLSNNEIDNISFLQDLKQLTKLDLRHTQINDISFLKGLKQLTKLNLRWNQIDDISFLKDLKQLAELDLGYNQINDISFLKGLKQLTALDLEGNGITEVSILEDLEQLKILNLSGNQIDDISFLENLKQLDYLHLSDNPNEHFAFFIGELRQLKSLSLDSNYIFDISFIKDLNQLTFLSLNGNQISDISFLENLNSLNYLNLSYNSIRDISFLKNLKELTSLELHSNYVQDISFLENIKTLNSLSLWDNPIAYVPKEICEIAYCINELKSYWQDIKSSQKTTNTQLKIMFLGNGCTGKTTLLHWFIDDAFKDIGLESRTHGIFIKPLKLCKGEVLGNFWDFGGQEVYHATHRLFLGRRTLYILVWASETPETENELRHPPQYWLDMIADIADKNERSRVLIVQNLFDNQIEQNVLTDEELKNYAARGLDITRMSVDAKEGDNIDAFKTSVESNAKKLLDKYKEELPETWVNIRTKVAEHRENKEKTLTFADFEQICVDCKLTGDPSVILGYLHRAGEVFYYEKQFNNQIILDQEWALKAVYAVLKNTNKEQFNRPFKLNLLIDIWQKENNSLSVEDAKIFMNFMLSNQIMFSTEAHSFGEKNTEFVIPQLLTDSLPIGAKSNKNRPDALIHRIDYAFLHRDIIERFIINTAQFSKDKEYWKNGVFIEFNNAFAIVEVLKENDKNKINIECFGTNKADLLQKIREEFNKIRPLDKAKEYRFVNDNWQVFNAKLDHKDVEKSGFEMVISPQFNAKIEELVEKIMKKKAKKGENTEGVEKSKLKELIANGKTKDVLNTLISYFPNGSEEQNEVILLTSRFENNNKLMNKATISQEYYSNELNRINEAVLTMISALSPPSVFY